MPPLAPMPPTVATDGGRSRGLWAGSLRSDPVETGDRVGRVRRWMYAAAGDADTAVGAAVVDLGFASTAFVWGWVGGQVVTWEGVRPGTIRTGVAPEPAEGAFWRGRDRVSVGGDGSLDLDVRTDGGRLRARISTVAETAATLATVTRGGGWNCTEKAAGYGATGEVELGDAAVALDGGGWRDWTSGRQDRHTVWRWAAGAGTSADGRRVGLNTSTGMNGEADGEDVVWWDGVPYPLDVTTLAPVGADHAGDWDVAGPGWALRLHPVGVRAADEDYKLIVSRYTQPIGRFTGTLPDPDGRPVQVTLTGVTEDHEARW